MSLSSSAFLDVADRIGNRLCRDAIWSGDRCNWLGWTFVAQGAMQTPGYRGQGVALRDGIAGIALFFAWLHHFTRDPLHARTLHGALRQLDRALADPADREAAATPLPDALPASGFHGGVAGVAAACLQIGELLRDDDWLARGLRLLDDVARDDVHVQWARTNARDVASGAAGSIPVLLRADARFDLPHLTIAATRQADILLDAARPSEDGPAWPMPDDGVARPFLGYAHGAGGMACALLDLDRTIGRHRAIGGDRYRAAAIAALRDERRHLAAIDALGWSDGASSVACALLRASELLAPSQESELDAAANRAADDTADDAATVGAEIEAEAEALLRAIATRVADARPWADTFCLSRGLAGCGDVLLYGAERLGRPALRQAAEMLGELGIVHFDRPRVPWPCGLPGIGGSPNLLLGLAGVGYFYLRLHQPHVVPSVLVLRDERPAARAATDRLRLETLADLVSAPAALPEAP